MKRLILFIVFVMALAVGSNSTDAAVSGFFTGNFVSVLAANEAEQAWYAYEESPADSPRDNYV